MSVPNNWGDWRPILTPHTGNLQATDLIECTMIVAGNPVNTAITGAQIMASSSIAWGAITGTLSSQVDLQTDLNAKQPTLISGTNIKTINSTSLLGSGNIAISSGLTVGTTAISAGTIGGILFQNGSNLLGQDAALFWDNTNKRLGIGATPAINVRLDVRAQGALSTDLAFRIRNSADTANIFQANGNGNVYSNGKGLVASNTAFGKDTLNTNTTGGNNVVLGSDIMQSSTTASANIAIGVQALYANVTGAGNTAVGNQSLAFNTAGGNTAVGNLSSKANIGGSQNVAIGTSALTANQTGSDITAVGSEALQACTVGNNTSIGRQSSYSVTTGTGNTAVGKLALYGITTGIDNIHIGKNTGVLGITTGSYNTLIGGAISGLATTTANNVILADGQGNKVVWFDSTNSLISNIKIDTVTGVKFGTATTQKIGFWNATPVVQPTTAVASSTFIVGVGTAVNDTATFDGYTIGQVVKALRNMGILA